MEEERSDWICLTPPEFYQAILYATEEGKGFGQQSSIRHNHKPGGKFSGETAQCWMCSLILHRTEVQFSAHTMVVHNHLWFQPHAIPHPLLASKGTRHAHGAHTYIHTCRQNTHEHKNELQRKKNQSKLCKRLAWVIRDKCTYHWSFQGWMGWWSAKGFPRHSQGPCGLEEQVIQSPTMGYLKTDILA